MVKKNDEEHILLFNAVHRMSRGSKMKPEDMVILNFRFPELEMHILSDKEVWELFDAGHISRKDFIKYIRNDRGKK